MSVLSTQRNKIANTDLLNFTQGLAWDKQLAVYEVAVQRAWAAGLAEMGILSSDELAKFNSAMVQASVEIADGTFPWRVENEDIHMNLEAYVTAKHGDLGKKVHLGRSRNDLIATTLRLYAADRCRQTAHQIIRLSEVLLEQARKTIAAIMPGMTHLQNGQPVRLGHVLSAYCAMFMRDLLRLEPVYHECKAYMPLGSAAFAGTAIAINLEDLAKSLGFARSPMNSYDAVSDRDFLVGYLQALNLINVHIARFTEDIIYWSSGPVRLVKLPKDWSTGSSIMPNKRNPDVAELLRAKATRQTMRLSEATCIYKAIPTSYGTDLHEMKKTFIDAALEQQDMLSALEPFAAGLDFDHGRALELCEQGHILATEIADLLTQKGLAFRDAYSLVATWTEIAGDHGCQIHQLPDFPGIPSGVSLDDIREITFTTAVERRNQPGGTAIAQVELTISDLHNQLAKEKALWKDID